MKDEKQPSTIAAKTAIAGKKVGIYLCYCGGNISDHVNVETVRDRVEKIPGVTVARTNMFMCSDPGQELIMEDLKNGTVDRVVVASCAPSLHEATFRSAIERAGANPFIYEHANIREQVSWVHHGDRATEKATRLVAAAAAKAEQLTPWNRFGWTPPSMRRWSAAASPVFAPPSI
jgi:heterodisulfide reductase subunit A